MSTTATGSNAVIVVKNAVTLNASGSQVVVLTPCSTVSLIVNVKASPTGTNPTLTWTVAEVDPVDQTTTTGASIVGSQITASGTQTVTIGPILSGTILVSWTIGGTSSPTFTLVNASLIPDTTPVAQFNTTQPTLPTGNGALFQCDSRGNLRVVNSDAPQYEDSVRQVAWTSPRPIIDSTSAWTITSSASGGVGTAGVSIKASAGRIRLIRVSNANATTGFHFQVHNKASAAVNTDVPVDRAYVPFSPTTAIGQTTTVLDYGPEGLYLGTGISIAASTTIGTLTLLGATDCHYMIEWI